MTAADAGADAAQAAIRDAAARIAAAGESSPRPARDPVNLPMIRHWAEAIGDANPVYTDAEAAARSVHGGLVAPPAMAQVWTMRGLQPGRRAGRATRCSLMSAVLDEAGFTSVVATNCEQVYHRYLRHGEQLTVRRAWSDVTGPKRTALGEGWFVTTRSTWYVGAEAVASMLFRMLKFRPAAAAPASRPGRAGPRGRGRAAAGGLAGHRVLLGRDRRRRAADPALRRVRRAAAPAGADVPGVRRGQARVRRRRRHRRGLQLRRAPSPAGAGQAAPARGRARRSCTEGVRMVGELLGVSPDRCGSACRSGSSSSGSTTS